MPFSLSASGTHGLVTKLVSLLLVFCFSTTVFAQDIMKNESPKIDKKSPDYIRGKTDGKDDADKYYRGNRWRTGGFVGGLLTGLAGTVIILGVSQIEDSVPIKEELTFLNTKTLDYQKGYCGGYLRKARTKRIGPVLVGGVVGSIFGAGIAYAIVKTRK